MHPFEVLKQLLLDLGANEGSESADPGSFGSRIVSFTLGDCELRALWDGKEECGIVQLGITAEWVDLAEPMSKDALLSAADFPAKSDAIRRAIKAIQTG